MQIFDVTDTCTVSKILDGDYAAIFNLQANANLELKLKYKACGSKLKIDITVNHNGDNSASDIAVRGIADGNADVDFRGLIDIAPGLSGIYGNMQHKGLLLDEKARIKGCPTLKVASEDVKCSHGNAIGQLDNRAIFYLESRGIDRQTAKTVLAESFLND